MIELSYGYRRLSRIKSALQKQYDKKPTDELKAKLDKFKKLHSERDAQGVNRALASMGIAVSGRERLHKFEAIGELIELGIGSALVKLPFMAKKGHLKGLGRRAKLLRSSKVGKMDEVDTPTKPNNNLEEVMGEPIEFARLQRLKRYAKRKFGVSTADDLERQINKTPPSMARHKREQHHKKLKRAEHSGKLRAFKGGRKPFGTTPELLKYTGGARRRKTKGRHDDVRVTTMRGEQPLRASGNKVAGVKGKVEWSKKPVVGVDRSRGKGTIYKGEDEGGRLVKQIATRRGATRVVR